VATEVSNRERWHSHVNTRSALFFIIDGNDLEYFCVYFNFKEDPVARI
jgi:hypothetical protein